MSTKRKKNFTWLLVSLGFIAFLFFAKAIVKNDDGFLTVYSEETVNTSGNTFPAEVRVYASPAIKWQQASTGWKAAGWVFIAAFLVASHLISIRFFDRKKSPQSDPSGSGSTARDLVLFAVLFILAAASWFAGYSASLDQGSLVCTAEELKTKYGISQEQLDKVISWDDRHIDDENGLLTAHFTGK